MLRTLAGTGQLQDNVLSFKVETGPDAKIDLAQKTLLVADRTIPIKIIIGTSDVTSLGEIYVPDSLLKDALGLDYKWSEDNYEYTSKVEKDLDIFKANAPSISSLLSTKVDQLASNLPETEPPALPVSSRRFLTFMRTELRVDSLWQQFDEIANVQTQARPVITFWGNLLNGYYRLRLAENIYSPHTQLYTFTRWIDEGVWSSKSEKMAMQVGDTNIGFSDLVAPGVNLFGASLKMISGAPGNKPAPAQLSASREKMFLAKGVIDGYAQLKSTVELWVNNQLIQTKIVEDAYNLKPGYGYYRFEGFGLLDKSYNEVKVVVKRPDGVVEESYHNVMGTSQLLPPGQWATLAGIGTHREKTLNSVDFNGFFSGAQFYYGLLKNLTVGVTAASQEKFAYFSDNQGNFFRGPRDYHAGQQAALNLFDRVLVKEEFGYCYTPDSSVYSTAFKTGIEYYQKSFKLASQFFYYEPQYSNAVFSVSDREGVSLSGDLRLFRDWLATGLFLYLHDNTNKDLDHTSSEKLLSPGLIIPGLIPKSIVRLGMDYSDRTGRPDQTGTGNIRHLDKRYAVEISSELTGKLNLEGRYIFGDQIDLLPQEDLKYNIPISGLSRTYFFGKMLKASYMLTDIDNLYATYWYSELQNQAEVSHLHRFYNDEGKYVSNSRLDVGEVINSHKYYSRAFLEFNLDELGYNRWGLKAGFDQSQKEYYGGLYVSLSGLFAFHDGGMRHVNRSGISPEDGGIAGTVYLDLNGNGHRDEGEPGAPNIKLMIDGQTPQESDQNGNFYIPRNRQKEFVIVSIDLANLPAIYIATQGRQKVYWKEAVFTRCNLGIGVLNAVSGTVKGGRYNGVSRGLSGMRVILMSEDQKNIIADSVTADDGTYYIGEIKPGNYVLDVDMSEIPRVYEPREQPFKITIPASKEPTEVENCDINLFIKK